MSAWRNAGITYIRYSQIAAAVTRQCAQVKKGAQTTPSPLKIAKWQNGKIVKDAAATA